MEHKLRRFRQQLPTEESAAILNSCTNAVLSLVDTDGAPYGVPISYAYDGAGHIYLHSALSGHKIDCISSEARCSLCVVAQDHIVPEEFTTYYRSVIVSGRISMITDKDETIRGLHLLCGKYCHGIDPTNEINRFISVVRVLRIDIERISGKESIELVRNKNSTE